MDYKTIQDGKYEVRVYKCGSKWWYLNGQLHREGGPAAMLVDGSKIWSINGQHHREDGPAIEWPNGDKGWYINGLTHREDGPAVEWANGDKEWWISGKQLTKQEWLLYTGRLHCECGADKCGTTHSNWCPKY